MNVSLAHVEHFRIENASNLEDPIDVFVQDFSVGQGRITIRSYDKVWSYFGSHMHENRILDYIAVMPVDLMAERLLGSKGSTEIDYDGFIDLCRERLENDKALCPKLRKDHDAREEAIDSLEANEWYFFNNQDEVSTAINDNDWQSFLKTAYTSEFSWLLKICSAVQKAVPAYLQQKSARTNYPASADDIFALINLFNPKFFAQLETPETGKYQCINEFDVSTTDVCPECWSEGRKKECEICEGISDENGSYHKEVKIPWSTQKDIWLKLNKCLANEIKPLEEFPTQIRTSFIVQMDKELKANAVKGNWDDWKPNKDDAFSELEHHVEKLKKALQEGKAGSVTEFSADIANITMKISEQHGEES